MNRGRIAVVVALACLATMAGCQKLLGRAKLIPDHGPLEGNTEVSIYVPECGDHSQVKEVLFGNTKQNIVGLRSDEVKVRTGSSQSEQDVPVVLILPNQLRCETGAKFGYQKMDSSSLNYIFEQGVTIGARRPNGWRPDLAAAPSP